MADAVLTVNAGSSSLKFSVYRVEDGARLSPSADGQIEGIGTSPHFLARGADGRALVDERWPADRAFDHDRSFRVLGGWLREFLGDTALLGVGHRVVHGGVDYAAPVRIDPAVLARLEALCPLAPLHQPHNLAGIRAVAAVQPDLPAGRVLRHRVPPRPPRARRLVRPAPPVLRRRRPPLRLPRPVLRVHRERAARGRAGDRRRGAWWSPISAAAPACAR